MDMESAQGEHDLPPEGTPEQFVTDLEALGPTFVKLGQMLPDQGEGVRVPTIALSTRLED
ncbi:hypothetical protein NB693_24545 [Pantoea ananatis]|uniref:hypothetical protein n=1 Tax=Pantoea ananas TaxID=553 RepID=UPI00221EF92B|nr:hypothetical protein [Pantoea ananatis]